MNISRPSSDLLDGSEVVDACRTFVTVLATWTILFDVRALIVEIKCGTAAAMPLLLIVKGSFQDFLEWLRLFGGCIFPSPSHRAASRGRLQLRRRERSATCRKYTTAMLGYALTVACSVAKMSYIMFS
jgi:hypothetical protein